MIRYASRKTTTYIIKNCFKFGTKKGLHFKITLEQALSIMDTTNHISSKSIPDFPPIDPKKKILQLYLPFYSADVQNVQTQYQGYQTQTITTNQTKTNEKGQTYQVKNQKQLHHPISGVLKPHHYQIGSQDTLIYADFEFPRKMIESCFVQNISNFQVITQKDIGKYVHLRESNMSVKLAVEKILQKIENAELKRAQKQNDSNFRWNATIKKVNINKDQLIITLKKFYLPAYIFKSSMAQKTFKVVNGYSGQYASCEQVDKRKLGLIFMPFALLGLVLGQAQWQTYLYILPSAFSLGWLLGGIANQMLDSQYRKDKNQKENDVFNILQQRRQDQNEKQEQKQIQLNEEEARILHADYKRIYLNSEFQQVCKRAKKYIERDISLFPIEKVQCMKQIDKVKAQVKKRNHVS